MLGRQLELTGDENENIPLYYYVVDNFQIQFGRKEFCLVTWLKFGVENWTDYNDEAEPIPFRRRVFSSSFDGRPIRGKHVKALIKIEAFNKLDDNDAVCLCCVGILQLVLFGLEDRRPVPNWKLRRWPALYATQPTDEVDKKSYSITWAFKSFRAATNDYYTRYRCLSRIVAWSSKNKFYRNMLKPFLHGQLPVERLVPDETEARSRWWVSSRAYFDGRNIEDERIPRHLNKNNYFEVPSEMYREFEEQRRGYKQMMEKSDDMRRGGCWCGGMEVTRGDGRFSYLIRMVGGGGVVGLSENERSGWGQGVRRYEIRMILIVKRLCSMIQSVEKGLCGIRGDVGGVGGGVIIQE
ncbi:hypothetical protein Tco_1262798 [Tanacetum coccineum]